MPEPSIASRILDFVWAVIGYWYVWVTTVPFVIDQGLSHKFLPKRFVEWADRQWPPDQRHHVLKWLCVVGFEIRRSRTQLCRAAPAEAWAELRMRAIDSLRW
jgi:hypothetical protein